MKHTYLLFDNFFKIAKDVIPKTWISKRKSFSLNLLGTEIDTQRPS